MYSPSTQHSGERTATNSINGHTVPAAAAATHSHSDHEKKEQQQQMHSSDADSAPAAGDANLASDTSDGGDSRSAASVDKAKEEKRSMVMEVTEVSSEPYGAAGKEGVDAEADAHRFKNLSWPRLTICLLVEAVALGSLSMPAAAATLGLVPFIIICIGIGMVAIYTSLHVGEMGVRFPQIASYGDAGRVLFGRVGYEVFSLMFYLLLTLITGSHVLTGTIAFLTISNNAICSLAFGVIAAIILFVLALPPTFHDVAWLGFVDFVSIIVAILVTMVATGIQAAQQPGGFSAVEWTAWPAEGTTFVKGMLAVTQIAFAYSFAVAQFSFQAELKNPRDYKKACWALGILEICIYTITGVVIYLFVGKDVQSPALLSAGGTMAKVAFGLALPVIYISGSINTTCVARALHLRMYQGTKHEFIRTPKSIGVWVGLNAGLTVIAFIVAEAIPVFSDLLGLISSLFISGFSFSFPPLFWYFILREEGPLLFGAGWRRVLTTLANAAIFMMGLVLLVGGTFSSAKDISDLFKAGDVRRPFTCDAFASG
ncbi:unnamed protein product [Tilletia controversa]|uniref:Amino acid transporter transmembrane domain-containing protein n=3 Tax=Tilletia TaxID=13289 RepID=A0A8X7N0R6_9BASI|nr:hypothetical protein CF336_g104 [Tilletia laevis]KAE8204959.1 hypothetical protein CF328_g775 [Tilletia controversa]KAE8265080.1 hypothetical protein A4X03_0g492 [Tilletia caries]KAE8208539.1 hypothetical protein CF335_g337 [Tilletia laevis]KAE8255940.1 hypothetical protein A4X06_0g172 [Tilletia controversa]